MTRKTSYDDLRGASLGLQMEAKQLADTTADQDKKVLLLLVANVCGHLAQMQLRIEELEKKLHTPK